MLSVDRSSPIPLYYQLKQILLEKMSRNEWSTGEMIPSEQELQETYGLSRTTVRQTLSELVTEGRLVRQRGRGTFVAQPKVTHNPSVGLALSEELQQQGLTPHWKIISRGWREVDGSILQAMGVSDEELYVVELIFSAENEEANTIEPIGTHFAYLPSKVMAKLNSAEMDDDSWLVYLRTLQQTPRYTTSRTLEAIGANALFADRLGMSEGAPLLAIRVLVKDARNKPVELIDGYFKGDRFKYQLTSE